MEVEIEQLARKKTKQVAEEVDKDAEEMTEGRFRAAIVEIMARMDIRMRQQSVEANHLAKAAELTNILLQCLAVVISRGFSQGYEG